MCPLLLPDSSILGEPPSPHPTLRRGSLAFSLLWGKGRVEKDASIVGTSGPSWSTCPSLGLVPHPPVVLESVSLSLSWCLWSPPRVPGPRPRSESQAALSLCARAEFLCPSPSPALGAGAGWCRAGDTLLGPGVPSWSCGPCGWGKCGGIPASPHPPAAFLPCGPWGGLKAGCSPLRVPKFCGRMTLQPPPVLAVGWESPTPAASHPLPVLPLPELVLETLSLGLFLGISSRDTVKAFLTLHIPVWSHCHSLPQVVPMAPVPSTVSLASTVHLWPFSPHDSPLLRAILASWVHRPMPPRLPLYPSLMSVSGVSFPSHTLAPKTEKWPPFVCCALPTQPCTVQTFTNASGKDKYYYSRQLAPQS